MKLGYAGHRRVAGRVGKRWLAGGGAAVVAVLLSAALVAQAGVDGACAAPPTGDTVHRGKATFYTLTSGGGNCSYPGPPTDGLYVALGPAEYADAAACGGYLEVSGPKGKVRVKVVDQCPECPPGHLDLSRRAFARIADPVRGVVPVTYRAVVDPPLPGSLAFRIKEGASQWWFAVLVDDHGNPLREVRARSAGGSWQRLTRTDYNYWLFDSGLGGGPFTVRVTDVYGRQATATGIDLAPERTQRSRVSMYDGARGAERPSPRAPRPSPAVRGPSVSPAPDGGPAATAAAQAAGASPTASGAAPLGPAAGRSRC